MVVRGRYGKIEAVRSQLFWMRFPSFAIFCRKTKTSLDPKQVRGKQKQEIRTTILVSQGACKRFLKKKIEDQRMHEHFSSSLLRKTLRNSIAHATPHEIECNEFARRFSLYTPTRMRRWAIEPFTLFTQGWQTCASRCAHAFFLKKILQLNLSGELVLDYLSLMKKRNPARNNRFYHKHTTGSEPKSKMGHLFA